MENIMDLGDFSVKAREIGNGFLSFDDYNDYYFNTAEKCFGEFVNEEMPKQIVLGDREAALDSTKSFSWSDVLGMIRHSIRENGEGEIIGNIDIQLDIKVKAVIHEE